MQHGVGVVENVALGDGGIAVVLLKLPQAPVGQVVLPVAVFVVTIEGKTEGRVRNIEMEVYQMATDKSGERLSAAAKKADNDVILIKVLAEKPIVVVGKNINK